MVADVLVLKQRIDNLSSTLSKGAFTDSLKSDFDACLEALESLKVDREVLQTTRIGTSLTKLSKSLENHCKDSSSKITCIIERWKSQLRSVNATNATKRQKTADGADSTTRKEKASVSESNIPSFSDTREDSKEEELDLPAYSGPVHSEVVRDKALRYLFRCFLVGQDFGPELNKLNALVYEIENALYDHYVVNKNAQKEYNLQLKCISFNFKDIKNTFFNYKVYSGAIPVSELVTMSSLQMASDEKKMQRSVILEQSLEACQSDWAIKNIFLNQKSKGQFKCGKCNSRQTTYYQLQTRSSDEPMTTFVTCLNCKNRWRF
ncbi:transcription elongation factor [Theileria orientalis strain Shintoku]|uniref:Transcription elongation factor n=1 Tax=Theileria orientalis strain Shintoku TaxID=869250 RepID=J4D5L8_THEOR|nr:transcription elongation factor [Theileria orientalis strain Shintoku]BAM39045.1 transcription elongation factor [Theileria orientalis strain Shintoku]|eukprot:XP_009689346.1 transcription elongation factor [Theileria orientalis strain Shintoku]